MLWVWFTLLAACMQVGRNAVQKQLSLDVPVLGVTLARFIYAMPLALLYLLFLYHQQPTYTIPQFSTKLYFYVIGASIAQILATALMVQLFRLKNYAIGVGLAKSEAVLTAILGVMFFATEISWLGWLGVILGGMAIFLMTGVSKLQGFSWQTLAIGLGSGLSFALTSLWVREASLTLNSDFLLSAGWVLFAVISLEAVMLLVYLAIAQRETLVKLWQRPKLTIATSIFSFLGSFGWFNAMSLKDVAFVKTVGQIEIVLMLMVSYFIFKERLKAQDLLGLVLVVMAGVLVVWG